MNVVYDLSPVTVDPAHRAGLARVTLKTAELLAADPGVSVRFSSVGSVRSLVWTSQVLASWPEAVPALPPTRLAKQAMAWEAALDRRVVGGGRAAAVGLKLIQTVLRVWNLARQPVPTSDLRWADLFHSSYARVPPVVRRMRRLGVVVSIMDLTPLKVPAGTFSPHQLGVTRRILDSVRRTDWVITISDATRADFLNYSGHPPERVTTIPLAADTGTFRPCADLERIAAVRAKYRVPPGQYVLTLSSLAPNKNVRHLVRAFARATRTPELGQAVLLLAGGQGRPPAEWAEAVGKLGNQIHFTGFVADADLAALYSGAAAFAFPSLYEGFGLPALEAMQCGVPVVASDSSSLPEIVGDAGLLVPPTDELAWADAITRMLTDDSLRTRLSAAGRERAATFTWERVLRETRAIYNRVTGAGRG